MKFIRYWAALLLVCEYCSYAQPDELYINKGFVDTSSELPINATTFINEGSFTITSSDRPFDTLNTLNYTNRGVMNASIGFIFENIDDRGIHRAADNFFNDIGSEINAVSDFFPTRVQINATNVEHHGLITVGSSGLIDIVGDNVNLANGGLGVVPISGVGSSAGTTNYTPDAGISDVYWGGLTNALMNSAALLNIVGESANLTSPNHMVTNEVVPFLTSLRLQGADSFIYSNAVTETNIIIQAVFSSLGDPRILSQARFTPSPRTNEVTTPIIEYRVPLTNVVTGSSDLFTLYLSDTLAWDTNLVFYSNANANNMTYKPSTYMLDRVAPIEWALGFPGTGELTPELLWSDTYTNSNVTNFYAAYSAVIENTSSESINSQSIPLDDQAAGRIKIRANNLDLSNLRIRGEGLVTIEANNIINTVDGSGSGAIVDVQSASYSLASTGPVLNIDGLTVPTVDRFAGALSAYSAIWTNQSGIVVTNPPTDPDNPDEEETYTTNVVTYLYHVMMVDATGLRTVADVITHDFNAKAENVRIADDFAVVRSFEVESENVTIDSDITLFSRINNLGATNFLNLLNFTNNGALSVNEVAEFGTDRDLPLNRFINRGAINAFSQRINSDTFENSGQMAAGGRIEIESQNAKLDNGSLIAGRDMVLSVGSYKMRNARIDVSGRLFADIGGTFTDGGGSGNNNVIVRNGFEMLQAPADGDLLGTFISSQIPRFGNVNHVWRAADLGPSQSGFKDNAAIGTLQITGPQGSRARFSARGQEAALYVDFLQFGDSFISNWQNALIIDPGFTLYFAGSNVAAEELDGAFDGRLQWVPSFAGPNTSVPVVLSDGSTIIVNRDRKESLILDDDGDGVANGIDGTPFDGVVFTEIAVETGPDSTASISWMAAGNTTYRVEFTPDVTSGDWTYLKSATNEASSRQVITVTDDVSGNNSGKYYRVTYQP